MPVEVNYYAGHKLIDVEDFEDLINKVQQYKELASLHDDLALPRVNFCFYYSKDDIIILNNNKIILVTNMSDASVSRFKDLDQLMIFLQSKCNK